MLREDAWPNMGPTNWEFLAKRLWESALDDPVVAVMEAPPLAPNAYSLAVVGILHPTLRVVLTSINADEKHGLEHAQSAG